MKPYQEFLAAVQGMASSSDSLQERLSSAFESHINLVKAEDVPDSAKSNLSVLKDSHTWESVLKLSDEEARGVALTIFNIFDTLSSPE
jgi:hypothetical protein